MNRLGGGSQSGTSKRQLVGLERDLPYLGLDPDGANRTGNKLLNGMLDPKEACRFPAPAPARRGTEGVSAPAVRCGGWRGGILCELPRSSRLLAEAGGQLIRSLGFFPSASRAISIDGLDRRTEPDQIARALSPDARNREAKTIFRADR